MELRFFVKLLVLGGELLFGVVLPAIYILVFRDPDVLHTCEAADPNTGWLERCPKSVLGLSLGLAACGVLALPMAIQGVVPLFGRVVDGWAGAASTILGAA